MKAVLEFHPGQMQAKQAKTNLTQRAWDYKIVKRFYKGIMDHAPF